MMQNKCRTCGLLDKQQQVCRLYGVKRNPNEDFCSDYTSQPPQVCEQCNKETIAPVYTSDETKKWHILCEKCGISLNTCAFCKNNKKCDFETNPSLLPKIIQQRTPIGVITVRNPARVAETCQKNCPCYSPNFECMREFNCCNNISYIYEEEVK